MSKCRVESGQYIGEISALCFLHPPSHLSSIPFLLAGTGSQIILYNLVNGNIIRSFQVFDGIRVHGICCSIIDWTGGPGSFKLTFNVVVFGERRVKLFCLLIQSHNQLQVCSADFNLFNSLPNFRHWVLDVRFIKEHVLSSQDGNNYLAVGCSDNSVYFCDIVRSIMHFEVRCPDRCLLYSMRMWGDQVEGLDIASGTIFNEIIVWKVICPGKDLKPTTSFGLDPQLQVQKYEAFHLCRLSGHEGSVFGIAWSSNGSKLLSASDDRCARIWSVNTETEVSASVVEEAISDSIGSVLIGHTARVWDCCISDSLIVTVGEDCTCRIWGLDGIQLKMMKEHIGRGVWRCLYDPNSSLLVTAGFDSAIKVHQLHVSLSESTVDVAEGIDQKEIFILRIPNSSGHVGLMDRYCFICGEHEQVITRLIHLVSPFRDAVPFSKSEYVRCLQFICEDSLYVATNNGYLFHAKLSGIDDVTWTELLRVSEDAPVICLDLFSTSPSDVAEDWVAIGDGKGNMTVVNIIRGVGPPEVGQYYSWSAGKERQLLGTFWCQSLGNRFIFTADPKGRLKLWRLCGHSQSVDHVSMRRGNATLLAEFVSCFGIRIMCVDASSEEEVLVCGDLRGNLVLFSLSSELLSDTPISSALTIDTLSYFKGGHGISTVCSITVATCSSNQLEIHSTGADGCICYLEYDKDQHILEFIGMKKVKELSLIRSALPDAKFFDELVTKNYAVGFASADFIVWNLTTETKVVQIPCGGWRRPHSYYLGDVPELKSCFAFVKDNSIYIHRNWVPDIKSQVYPQNLHLQFHGREIHSLCFVSGDSQFCSTEIEGDFSKASSIATGCEDGTVRLSSYDAGAKNWSASRLLGEHVGGSAVRSICCVSKMHIVAVSNMAAMPFDMYKQQMALENGENPFLLISVGAKRVLTAWQQKVRKKYNEEEGKDCSSTGLFSFRWISTDMPTRNCSTHGDGRNFQKTVNTPDETCRKESKNMNSRIFVGEDTENDWRYLAVTAFLVKIADTRISVCFVVVACSDATVALRALVLPYRLWFDIAVFVPLASPVLALQHVIIPKQLYSEDNYLMGSQYIAISGSTDGSIAFWDLTESVTIFVGRVSALELSNYADCQKRPRTGRGSQGGRWWKLLSSTVPIKKSSESSTTTSTKSSEKIEDDQTRMLSDSSLVETSEINCCQRMDDPALLESESSTTDDLALEIRPLHTLNNIHKSGVNCLHVSDIKAYSSSDSTFLFHVISGGDDQALNFLTINLVLPPFRHYHPESNTPLSESLQCCSVLSPQKRNYQISLLYHENISSAHSSAVKGVWTDGRWVFSTGLDQRVRCWSLEEKGKLIERAHLIVSVPEPEALDARACTRNHYQIAVVGRGMQMIEFFPAGVIENGEVGGS